MQRRNWIDIGDRLAAIVHTVAAYGLIVRLGGPPTAHSPGQHLPQSVVKAGVRVDPDGRKPHSIVPIDPLDLPGQLTITFGIIICVLEQLSTHAAYGRLSPIALPIERGVLAITARVAFDQLSRQPVSFTGTRAYDGATSRPGSVKTVAIAAAIGASILARVMDVRLAVNQRLLHRGRWIDRSVHLEKHNQNESFRHENKNTKLF